MAVILFVDDEYFVRDLGVSIVEDLGHEVFSASSVDEALSHLVSMRKIDALLTDIRLNELTRGGYQIADEAIKRRPNLHVLYMTGTPLNDEMTEFFVEGAHFLQKPYSPAQLQNSLTTLLAEPV